MPDATKPKWVVAADKAEVVLDIDSSSPEDRDSIVRLAYAWIDLARLYRD